MFRPRTIQLIALVCGAGLVALASTRIATINRGRTQLNIMGSESPVANTPPAYVFYIQAFGAFRGLIADVAFIRADALKEQGRYYDAMQLHEWICALQPHFPSVWENAAWNLAWNISVTTFTPQERWNWVYNGVKLLRDHGIPLNPRAVNLYKQLAWTFNNKMSEPTDDHHYAYKCNWAWRMHLVLGPAPDPLEGLNTSALADEIKADTELDRLAQAGRLTFEQNEARRREALAARGQEFKPREQPAAAPGEVAPPPQHSEFEIAQRAAEAQLAPLVAAPDTLAELVRRQPETAGMIAALRQRGLNLSDDPLSEDQYWRSEGLAFAFFKPYRDLLDPSATLARVARRPVGSYEQRAREEDLDRILGVQVRNPAGQALVQFLQRKVLREVYKMEPRDMLELVREFGPMDWRTVDSQGLYWATRGLIAGGETISRYGNDKTNTARIIFFCLRNLFVRGRLVFEPNPDDVNRSYLSYGRDLNMIESMHQAFVRYGPLFDPDDTTGAGAGETYRSGHINFLTEAIRLLYMSGRDADANHYFRYLRTVYALTPSGEPNPAVAKSLHDFVMDSFLDATEAAGLRDILLVLDAWFTSAYNELADGDVTSYIRLMNTAREYHEHYMREKRNDPGWAGKRIPEFVDLQIDAFGRWFDRPAVMPGDTLRLSSAATLQKIRLWQQAPLYLRQAVYDPLLPKLKEECDLWEFDVARAFPEPKGMEEYRQQHPERFKEAKDPDVQNLPRPPG